MFSDSVHKNRLIFDCAACLFSAVLFFSLFSRNTRIAAAAVVDVFPVLLFLEPALFVICYCHRQIDHSVTNLQLNCLWNEIEINFQTVN